MAGTRIAAVMAVHNRKALTLACLDSLRAQQVPDSTLDVFVLDDASTDGTAEAVTRRHPDVRLLDGFTSATARAEAATLAIVVMSRTDAPRARALLEREITDPAERARLAGVIEQNSSGR